MNLIAIDPGRTTGWAVFRDEKELARCGSDKGRQAFDEPWWERPFKVPVYGPFSDYLVLIEHPRWYPHDQKDVNDLLDLAVLVGEYKYWYESLGCTVELVWPRTWKSNVKKEIMTERILSRLTPDELALVPLRPRAKTPDHNCVDAIGLGLWKLGRLR